MAKFSQLKDDLDFTISVIAEGQQVAKEISSNLAGLRGELKSLYDLQNNYYAAEGKRRAAEAAASAARNKAKAEAKALADEQRRLAQAEKEAADAARAHSEAMEGLGKKVLAAAAAFYAFQGFRLFVKEGLEFNQTLETANLGIGSLITAQADLRDSNGKLITGAAKLTAAQGLATDQVNKLRIAGLQTTATTEDLVVAFQQAVGVGLRWGLTLDQIRQLTIQMSQAAGALGLPMNQLNEEVRDLLGGNINPRNTRIATALGITNEQIKAAQKAGNLFDFVTGKLEAFSVAGEATARSFAGVMSNIKEAFQNFAGDATKPLFDTLKESGITALSEVFNMKDARISDNFKGLLDVSQEIFGTLGQQLSEAINDGVKGAEDLSHWFEENKTQVSGIIAGVVLLNGELKSTLGEVLGMALGIGDAGVKAGVFETIIVGIAAGVATVHELFQLIITALGIVGNLVLTAIVAPFVGWLRILARAASFFDEELGQKIDAAAQKGEDFLVSQFQGLIKYGEQLQNGGLALDQFSARIAFMEARAKAAEHAVKNLGTAVASTPITVTSTAAAPKPGNPTKAAQGDILASKAELDIALRDLKIALDNAQISFKDYYAKRTELQQHAIDEQIAAENRLLSFTTDEGAKEKIIGQIKTLQAQRLQVVDDNNEQLRLAEQKLDDETLAAQVKLLRDQGKLVEANALENEGRYRKMVAVLKANGRADGEAIVSALFDIDNAKVKMEELSKAAKTIQDQLTLDLSETSARRTAGAISEREAQELVVTAYSRARDGLLALIPEMEKAAAITKDPAQVAAVEQLKQKISEMGTTIARTSDEFIKLKEGGRDALQSGLADFLDQAVEGAKSLKDIWIGVASSVVASLRKIASQMLANLIIQQSLSFLGSLAGGISSGASGAGVQIAGDAPGGVFAASGGYISGPGSATSDSIPARLSNGEFVVNAAAVRTVGVEFLHAINGSTGHEARGRLRSRGYAEGGLVTSEHGAEAGGFAATIGLEEGLVARHIQTQRGTRAVLNVIAANRKAVRGVLGR